MLLAPSHVEDARPASARVNPLVRSPVGFPSEQIVFEFS